MAETKELVKHRGGQNVLEAVQVELESTDPTAREAFFGLVARQEVLTTIGMFNNLMWAENLKRLKDEGYYKRMGLTWEQAVPRFCPFSYKTADRMIATFEEFGRGFFQVRDLVRITAEAYRQIAPIVEDGHVIIGEEKIALTKANSARIQAAFESERKKAQEKAEELTRAKSDVVQARQQRDAAKKALEDIKRPKFVPEDEDHEAIVAAEADFFRPMMARLRALAQRDGRHDATGDMSKDNQARLVGLLALMAGEIGKLRLDVLETVGAEALASVYDTQVEGARSPMAEHLASEGRKVVRKGGAK